MFIVSLFVFVHDYIVHTYIYRAVEMSKIRVFDRV